LANARENPYEVLGDGLKWSANLAQSQGDEEGIQLVQQLGQLAQGFFQRIRNYMQHRSGGGGVAKAMAPKEQDANFREYQQEFFHFSKQYGDLLRRYNSSKTSQFTQQNPHFAGVGAG